MDDKRGGPLMIGVAVPEDDEDDGAEVESMAEDAKLTAAADVRRAFKKGDDQALSDALQRHYAACRGDEGDDEGDDEGG